MQILNFWVYIFSPKLQSAPLNVHGLKMQYIWIFAENIMKKNVIITLSIKCK